MRLHTPGCLLFAVLVACDRPAEPSAPTVTEGRPTAGAGSVLDGLPAPKDLPALTFDVAASDRPWDRSDEELAHALAQSGGRAFIALKTPGATSAAATIRPELVGLKRVTVLRGTRAQLSAAAIVAGLKSIVADGVVIRHFFDAFGVVEA